MVSRCPTFGLKVGSSSARSSRYICREWNPLHTGSEQLTNLHVVYIMEWTLPDYAYSTPQMKVLWQHDRS